MRFVTYDTVFIDMDGVLCDFISPAMAAHGGSFDRAAWPPSEWDVAKVLGVGTEEFWRGVDAQPDFWSGLQQYPWFDELLEFAKPLGKHLKLLSSPSRHPHCWRGKREWVIERLPYTELILCASKQYLAGPGRLLIDDSDINVAKWRQGGGDAVLFPQPWNRAHELADDPMAAVRSALVIDTTGEGEG